MPQFEFFWCGYFCSALFKENALERIATEGIGVEKVNFFRIFDPGMLNLKLCPLRF